LKFLVCLAGLKHLSSPLSLKQIFRSDCVVDVAPMPGVGDALHGNHSEADGFALADTF